MNARCCTLILSGMLSVALAETGPAPESESGTPPKSGWNLELVPKAFQKNPSLNITVLSEMSAAGKQRPAVSTENPIYYVLQPGGYQMRGEAINQKPFPAAEVEKILGRALAASGYLPATAEHSPSIVVVYMWGAHNVISPGNAISAGQVIRNILDRAALVGGDKFAADLAKAFRESNQIAEASARPLGLGRAALDDPASGVADLGAAAALNQVAGMADPVHLFEKRSPKNEYLLHQATANCYYIVATAFDYESLASPRRELLWRTRMTVNADGVSQSEAIPMLISVSTHYLGTDMSESEIITKRAVKKGQVDVGAPTVVGPSSDKPTESK